MKIDLLLANPQQHGLETFCLKGVQRAFEKMGVESRVFNLTYEMGEYLRAPNKEQALCFVDPLKRKRPLSDILCVPTFHWEVTPSMSGAVHLLNSEFTKVGFSDHSLKCRGLFPLCPGVDPIWEGEEEIRFETVLFDPLIDQTAKQKSWERLFSKEAVEALQKAAGKVITVQDLLDPMENIEITHNDWIYALEEIGKAGRIRALVESFCTPISLFGEHIGANWLVRLKNCEHVNLHSLLPFAEHLRVLKRAKSLVIDTPVGFDGLPLWFLVAPLCGSIPLIPYSPILLKHFGDFPIFYKRGNGESLQGTLLPFLKDEKKRKMLVQEMKERVLARFTWQHQIQEIKCFLL